MWRFGQRWLRPEIGPQVAAVVEVEVEVEVEDQVVVADVVAAVAVEVEVGVLVDPVAVVVVLVAALQVLLYVQVIQVIVLQGKELKVDGVPMGFLGLFSQDDRRRFHPQFLFVRKQGCWK